MIRFRILILLVIIFLGLSIKGQEKEGYRFLVAGHTYGAHAGTNIGLHPPFLEKLKAENPDSIMGIFLTGDIVNSSTSASWAQVASELSSLSLNSFYVMGNHDDNSIGHNVFQEKHGGLYYWFAYQSDLFIVLNSTESDRSISNAQLDFLGQIFANTGLVWKRAFIFFHEVIWNSDEKYKLVRSNSRSRYDQIKNVSNFWQEVFPRLTAMPDKHFYLFSGDVGGNPDAIAAFYDQRENLTLISSGMGEVADENYLNVNILPDTVTFSLVPLRDGILLHPIFWYNVPQNPEKITGEKNVFSSSSPYQYDISPVENATSYQWRLGTGMTGTSDSASIEVSFDENFQQGKISVTAVNDGFGISDPVELTVNAGKTDVSPNLAGNSMVAIYKSVDNWMIRFSANEPELVSFELFDLNGRIQASERMLCQLGDNTIRLKSGNLHSGIFVLRIVSAQTVFTRKVILM